MKIEATTKEIPQFLKLMEQMVPGLNLDAVEKMMTGITFDIPASTITKTLDDKSTVSVSLKLTP
jgi:hypothetical protein